MIFLVSNGKSAACWRHCLYRRPLESSGDANVNAFINTTTSLNFSQQSALFVCRIPELKMIECPDTV